MLKPTLLECGGTWWNLHQTVKGNYSDHPAWISRGAHTSRLSSCQLSRRGEVSKKKLMLSNDLIVLNVSSLATVLKAGSRFAYTRMIYCFRDHARYTNHLFRSWPCCSRFRWSCRWWGIKLSRKKNKYSFRCIKCKYTYIYIYICTHTYKCMIFFFPRRGSKVPCSTAQRVRLGHLEECGGLRDGFVDKECEKKIPSWKKNASRFAWSWIYRNKLGWNVTLKEFLYNAPNGDTVLVPYIDPQDLLAFLLEHHPDVLVGGTSNPQEMALHLESFWNGYKLQNAEHLVFREHANSLQSTIPLFYHGDEGRGKRRGNTVVLSCESPIGIHTTLPSRKRGRDECHCKPPAALERKYGRTTRKISSRLRPPWGHSKPTCEDIPSYSISVYALFQAPGIMYIQTCWLSFWHTLLVFSEDYSMKESL